MNHVPARPRVGERLIALWLSGLFRIARTAPWFLVFVRPAIVRLVPLVSRQVRISTRLNGARLLGKSSASFTREVVGSFYDFVIDVGRSARLSAAELREKIVAVEGEAAYLALRAERRGAVLVTAHMGSFEVGLAALRTVEPSIRVVFKRDEFGGFERIRKSLRQRMGIIEAPIDDGWTTLIGLRDALGNNEVVVMQADRAMTGQKARAVSFAGGTLRIPVGPVTLARIHGSPIVPVYTVRVGAGRYKVWLEPAIDADAPDAVEQIGRSIEKFVKDHPGQWLVLEPAFVEDAHRG
ncbi:MAG: lysophospholipid acyltransferase family protein [Burkholderiales bacterium]|nr:lysophospholipid acyltransferase family protein [Phycisphaerae bacterium]